MALVKSGRGAGWWVAGSVLPWLLHGLALALVFPLRHLFDATALAYIDSPFHLYQMEVAAELWHDFALVGYDPWLAAGHIGGVNFNPSAKVPALLAAWSHWPILQVYKLYVFAAALSAPGLVWLGLRWLKFDRYECAAGMWLAVLVWWVTQLHWYHTAGMVSFVWVSYAAVAFIAGLLHVLTRPREPAKLLAWRDLLELGALGMFGALCCFAHPLFVLPVLCMAVPMLIVTWPEIDGKRLTLAFFIVPASVLLLNLAWLVPTVTLPGLGGQQPFQRSVDIGIALNEAMGRFVGVARGARLNPLLWVLALCALLPCVQARMRRWMLGWMLGAFLLILFAALGAAIEPLATLQPNRQSGAAYLLLCVPAAVGLVALIRASFRHRKSALAARLVLFPVGMVTLFVFSELANELTPKPTPHYGRPAPEVRGWGETTLWLADWLHKNSSDQERILFETSSGRAIDDAHIAGPLARMSEREFIGGPYVHMHYAGFWDGFLFGRNIGTFTPLDFMAELRLHNVGWVVAQSRASLSYLDTLPQLRAVERRGPVTIYGVLGSRPSPVLDGPGRVVHRSLHGIGFEGLAGASATLSYHYVPGLYTEPTARIEPVWLPGSPEPFVRVIEPPPALTLRYRR